MRRKLGEPMREEGVDVEAGNRILRGALLLDDADAVDDRVGSNLGERVDDRVELLGRDADEHAVLVEAGRPATAHGER